MFSSAKKSFGLFLVSLILTLITGRLFGFSYNRSFSPFGSALILFFAFMLLFLVLFGLDYFVRHWRLEWNPWVVDVKEMGFWYNPVYWTWLFYHDHKKWAKWDTIVFSAFAVFVVTLFGAIFVYIPPLPPVTPEAFWAGWIIATTLMFLFAFTWYLYYTSVDRTPSPFPRGRLSDIPRRL